MKIVVHEEEREKVKKPRAKLSLGKKKNLDTEEALIANIQEAKARAEESMRKTGELGENEELQVDALQQMTAGSIEEPEDIACVHTDISELEMDSEQTSSEEEFVPTSEPKVIPEPETTPEPEVITEPEPEPVVISEPEPEPVSIPEPELEPEVVAVEVKAPKRHLAAKVTKEAEPEVTPEQTTPEPKVEETTVAEKAPANRKHLLGEKKSKTKSKKEVKHAEQAQDEEIVIAVEVVEDKEDYSEVMVAPKSKFSMGLFVVMLGLCVAAQFGVSYGVQQLIAKLISQTLGG